MNQNRVSAGVPSGGQFVGGERGEVEAGLTPRWLPDFDMSYGVTDPDELARLAESPDVDIRADVAENLNTPPEVLAGLASDPDMIVRNAVAEHLNTRPEDLAGLSVETDKEGDPCVRSVVAGNPSASLATLDRLARDSKHGVRAQVAANVSAPPAALDHLAEDSSIEVRSAVAGNRSARGETLAKLVAENPSDSRICSLAATNPSTPAGTLHALVRHGDPIVRRSLAKNRRLSDQDVNRLSYDNDASVRRSVARDSDRAGIIGRLAFDSDINVRVALSRNSNIDDVTRQTLANDLAIRGGV
ncbi:MAG: hypothetical protein ACRCYU_02300 [Nocardioides sp.]